MKALTRIPEGPYLILNMLWMQQTTLLDLKLLSRQSIVVWRMQFTLLSKSITVNGKVNGMPSTNLIVFSIVVGIQDLINNLKMELLLWKKLLIAINCRRLCLLSSSRLTPFWLIVHCRKFPGFWPNFVQIFSTLTFGSICTT